MNYISKTAAASAGRRISAELRNAVHPGLGVKYDPRIRDTAATHPVAWIASLDILGLLEWGTERAIVAREKVGMFTEALYPQSALDASRAETAAANARADALERERDETVLGSMLDIYRQRAEVDADQMAKLEAKLAKAVEALILIGNDVMTDHNGDRWQTEAAQIARRTLAEIEGKSK